MTKDDLEWVMRQLPVKDMSLTIDGNWKYVVDLVSPDFSKMDEAERQEMVWGHLITMLSDRKREMVEYVFVRSPEDVLADEAQFILTLFKDRPDGRATVSELFDGVKKVEPDLTETKFRAEMQILIEGGSVVLDGQLVTLVP